MRSFPHPHPQGAPCGLEANDNLDSARFDGMVGYLDSLYESGSWSPDRAILARRLARLKLRDDAALVRILNKGTSALWEHCPEMYVALRARFEALGLHARYAA